jgi:signal transduction histidine kinase
MDAGSLRGGDNGCVATEPHDPLEDVTVALRRWAAAARRGLAGPDGPLAAALVLALLAMAELTASADEVGPAMVANFLATLPLAFARRWLAPATVTIVVGAVFALGDETAGLTIAGLVGLLVALSLFAARYRRSWSALLALPFLANAIAPFDGNDPGFADALLVAVVVGALALGDSRRRHGQVVAELDESRRAVADSLHDQAMMEERARIARDLHDVVAHHVSAIAVQAETARLTIPDMPEEGKQQLEAIGQTARDALDEMRRLLGVLREDVNGEPARAPQPTLMQLGELVDTARAAGTTVRLTLSGDVTRLSPGVDLCAYRILQEALTNARRHAPGAAVDVEIVYGTDTLGLRVRDDGPGPATDEPDGHGLLGMRERAIMVGGTLTAGRGEDGGFSVEAELPIRGAA